MTWGLLETGMCCYLTYSEKGMKYSPLLKSGMDKITRSCLFFCCSHSWFLGNCWSCTTQNHLPLLPGELQGVREATKLLWGWLGEKFMTPPKDLASCKSWNSSSTQRAAHVSSIQHSFPMKIPGNGAAVQGLEIIMERQRGGEILQSTKG